MCRYDRLHIGDVRKQSAYLLSKDILQLRVGMRFWLFNEKQLDIFVVFHKQLFLCLNIEQ